MADKPVLHRRDHEHGGADPVRITWESDGDAGTGGTGVVPYSVSGELEVAGGGLRWYAPTAGTVKLVHASVGTAPAGSGIEVVVDLNGSSFATVTISDGANVATVAPDPAVFDAGDYFTVDVTAVGSSTAGSDLVVQLRL